MTPGPNEKVYPVTKIATIVERLVSEAYIEEHPAEDIAVADLANVACLSIFHFARAFATTMGVPPHRYVSRRRLESAKDVIATGRASLAEIALDSRFSSQSSFTRAFRRATGMTPAEYRRACDSMPRRCAFS
jgi:AraC family transcriptional regulator